ncbi:MAG: NADP-specific glutamate dehydrogenase [Zetaproteobacteria bacterium]|nr:NADP-specific glutamate dehydrogenase [Pseudobdellovibrionaceae bacterium]|tara:strand:- start:2041 stop:3390 length:1350 start_codon:yes stop_codon:yes gene_type:complete
MPFQKLKLDTFMNGLTKRNPGEKKFHQAVYEVANDLIPYINKNPQYLIENILERMTEADRIIIFRVCWEDKDGNVRTNRGYRVQYSNAIGPYKGGIRFHPDVNLDTFKFLAFEQMFKNSLTTLPMGAAKGGANFNPKGKTDREIMRFCQAYMAELHRHIGHNRDIPAGDIGVGQREINYLFGQFKKTENVFTGTVTGKSVESGGSFIRKEATGYGAVYFAKNMLAQKGESIKGKSCIISGSGNVAQYAAEKIIELGGKVLALSDSKGTLFDKDGVNSEKLKHIMDIKNNKKSPLEEYLKVYPKAEFHKNKTPWAIPCDMAFPCATENELDEEDAKKLISNNCQAVIEGANMPATPGAFKVFLDKKILFAPGKAANAGGVAISGLEMSQNSMRLQWSEKEIDTKLQEIMEKIHQRCLDYGTEKNHVNYVKGANIGGFVKVANTMLQHGIL